MKLVINNDYGGFSLSHKAIMRWAELSGKPVFGFVNTEDDYENPPKWVPAEKNSSETHFFTSPVPPLTDEEYDLVYFNTREIPRNDPALVQAVEELGKDANGVCASLAVIDLPKGTKYRITEYDGYESVETLNNTQWDTAT